MLIRLPRGYESMTITIAMKKVASRFGGNVKFRRFDRVGGNRIGGINYQVTLQPHSSDGKGAKRTYSPWKDKWRKVHAVCWHVYGTFIENLPEGTQVVTSTGRERKIITVGTDPVWVDYNVGSPMYPQYASEQCECDL